MTPHAAAFLLFVARACALVLQQHGDYLSKVASKYGSPEKAFTAMNTNGDGEVSQQGWLTQGAALGVKPEEMRALWQSMKQASALTSFATGTHGYGLTRAAFYADLGEGGLGLEFAADLHALEARARSPSTSTVAANSTAECSPCRRWSTLSMAEHDALQRRAVPGWVEKARLKYASPYAAYVNMDTNKDGKVGAPEWTDESKLLGVEPAVSWMAWVQTDHNHDKYLSKEEFYGSLGKNGAKLEWAPPGQEGPKAKPIKQFNVSEGGNYSHDDYVRDKQDKHWTWPACEPKC